MTEMNENPALEVLIVDDDPDMVELLSLSLRRQGMSVARAGDGIAAMELARLRRPHVAIIDIGLPHLDGHGLGRQLRETAGDRPVGLVAITGDRRDAARQASRAAGFDAHLVKPVDLRALAELIRGLRDAGVETSA